MAVSTFGLDIGRSFIKVVQVKGSGSKRILAAASSLITPDGGLESESPVDLQKVSEAIKSVRSSARIDTRKCTISIVESQVVTRLIQMPNLTDKELSAAIHWEAEQYIPLPLRDVNLQYKVVSRPTSATAKMEVLLTAAPKRVISKYLSIVKSAGLDVFAIETESAALSRSLTSVNDQATIIVSIGAASTELVIGLAGSVLFTRSIATGGLTLTRAIQNEFNLPPIQAEEYKQSYGIIEDKLSGKVAAVLKPILDILTSEILKAVQFTHSHVPESQIVRIIMCGGGSYLPGLAAFLVERTSLEVSMADPWASFAKEGLILKLPGQGSVYTVATGLALRT